MAERLKAMYDAGASIRDLAAETGRSYGHIHRLLHEAGATFRGRGGSRNRANPSTGIRQPDGRAAPSRIAASQRPELAARLKTEYEATHGTIGNLAQKHGLGYHLVRALLHEAGTHLRQGHPT